MEQTQSQEMRQELRQVLRMEQARLLEMPENEFHKLVIDLERSPLFVRLFQKERLIRYQRFPRTDIATSFYQVREEAVADRGSADVESLLAGKGYVVRQVQRLGVEKFKRYFLFPEPGMTSEAIARECGLEPSEVQKINGLIDEFSVLTEFYHPAEDPSGAIHYTRVAAIEKDARGLVIGYFSTHFARGRYAIDYESFERLRAAGTLSEGEAKETRQLFKRLELVNSRKDTLTRILQAIVDRQSLYLESGEAKSLLPYTQKELADRTGLVASSVSRAIRFRSIVTPWGAEVPLKHFFPRPKRFKQDLLRKVLESDNLASDEAIRAVLREKFGVAISRRSVAGLRRELKFPAGRGRRVAREKGA